VVALTPERVVTATAAAATSGSGSGTATNSSSGGGGGALPLWLAGLLLASGVVTFRRRKG
ncbi:MAG: MprA protease, GlyGly-CTERM protein-sorting domain-containing form, partial [Actinobacteria bacterium]|nr:MprA protease, GlyGly-CTERM protein-sorting domain-containing form [Actinomycetota bacterium]